MAKPMSWETQEAYEWPVAVYLFLGGVAGALMALGYIFRLFSSTIGMIGVTILSGVVLFALAGAVLVFFDLERPVNAVYSLNNVTRSGISWDVVLIAISVVFGLLYILPIFGYLDGIGWLEYILMPYQGWFGAIAATAGFLFPVISGGLLAAPVAIPLWHTPALPLLFLVTSFQLALSYIGSVFALTDAVYRIFTGGIFFLSLLIGAISLAFLEHAHNGPLEAKEGLERMLKNTGFILIYVIGSLAFPLCLNAYTFFSGAFLTWLFPLTAILLIGGGFTLRKCVVKNGVQLYPWPY